MLDFLTLLRENPYPGRGILVSRDLVYYFIMGRSANSRNRIFVKTEDGIRTELMIPPSWRTPASSSIIPSGPWATRWWSPTATRPTPSASTVIFARV